MNWQWNIRRRVLFLALVPTTVVLVVLAALFTIFRAGEIERSLEDRGGAIARHVARAAEFGLFAGDRVALQSVADDARNEADVDSVEIVDAQSQRVARSGRAPDLDAPVRTYVEPVVQGLLQFADVPDTASAQAPRRLGEVRVQMSRLATETAKQNVWRIALAVGACGLLLAATVALGIGRGVSAPIREQAAAIGAIAAGDLGMRVSVPSGGELQALAEGINRMAVALQGSQRDLEQKIANATQQLQQQKEAAEAANQAKSRFLAAASHDLRQPLHAIELFAAALRQRVQGQEARELGDKLGQAIASMDALFSTLLDIYRLDSGALQPEKRAFSIGELFAGLEEEFRIDALRRGLRLRVVPSAKVALSDPLLVRRIVANLLVNALRYTTQGTVLLACRGDPAGLRVEVRDSGPGIDEAEQENIFREFYRVADGTSERGMGLGLTIVARLAELLQASVQVRSRPGRGSVFSVILPRGRDFPAARLPSPWQIAEISAPHLGVLIVDDDPLVLQSTLALARDWKINVVTADNAMQARAVVGTLQYEAILVLSDLWLSNQENGLQLLDTLKAQVEARFFGMIVTGDTRQETAQRIQVAGYPVLYKPVSAAKLRATFLHYLGKILSSPMPSDSESID